MAEIRQVDLGRTAGQHPRQFALAGATAGSRRLEPLDHRGQDLQSAALGQLDLDLPETDVRRVTVPERTFLAGQEVSPGNCVLIDLGQRATVRRPQLGAPANTGKVGDRFQRAAEGGGLDEVGRFGMYLFELVATGLQAAPCGPGAPGGASPGGRAGRSLARPRDLRPRQYRAVR